MAFAFHILGTSSSGNCSLIEAGGARVMLDAGFQGPRLEGSLRSLGLATAAIDAVLITHEHTDHCVGLPALLRRHPALKVFANRETARRIQSTLKVRPDWQLFETGASFDYRGLTITSIPIPHDAADPVGFAVDCPAEDGAAARRVTWLTDLGHVTDVVRHHAALADVLVLESNYDEEMLDLSKRPPHLKQRIRGRHGHLSNDAARDLLTGLREWRAKELCLGHLSKECNRTILVEEAMREVRESRGDLRVSVFDPLEERPLTIT
ncbi:MAG: MBL fold metallo-hydrolase [Verrucomicrobiota bacterium]